MSLKYRKLPEQRRPQLSHSLKNKMNLRIMEVHDGLSGLVANSARVVSSEGNVTEFHGLWVSSLTDSSAKGHPDTEIISFDSRLLTIQEITAVTDKPLIVDGDTGGDAIQFEYFCAKLESAGVSAVVIEDKEYPKRNSLAADAIQNLEDPHVFAEKIARGKSVCLSKDFLIFARLESFISGRDLDDALMRAKIYLAAGADGIVIHSNQSTPTQVYEFAKHYQKLFPSSAAKKPLICIPTTYSDTSDDELFAHNFDIVIYANYQLRAAHKAMQNACLSILEYHNASLISGRISTVKEIFKQVGFDVIKEKDIIYQSKRPPVLLLSAGVPMEEIEHEFNETPITNLMINEKKLIDIQLKTLKQNGFNEVILATGYMANKVEEAKVKTIHNPEYQTTTAITSLALAKEHIEYGCICIYGDILFEGKLLEQIDQARGDITIVIDHTRNLFDTQSIKPSIDLVVANKKFATTIRHFNRGLLQVKELGHGTFISHATHEFVGMVKFSRDGIMLFLNILSELKTHQPNKVVDMVDVLEMIIERGYLVEGLEVTSGWLELHNIDDLQAARQFLS